MIGLPLPTLTPSPSLAQATIKDNEIDNVGEHLNNLLFYIHILVHVYAFQSHTCIMSK